MYRKLPKAINTWKYNKVTEVVIIIELAEIFYSLQGEGPSSGKPSIFIRLSKCNLSCVGCDTIIKDKVEEVTDVSLNKRIESHMNGHPNARIVITGGEPFLQPDAIKSILDRWPKSPVDVETNGTLELPDEVLKRLSIIVVCPKRNTFPTVKERVAFFKKWCALDNVYLKIVVGPVNWMWSESEIRDVIKLSGVPLHKIFVMPGGGTVHELEVSGKNCWKVAARLGVNYSDRLHLRCAAR